MNHKKNEGPVRWRVGYILPFLFLVIFLGCEQILDEALTKAFTVRQTLISDETASSEAKTSETIPIINSGVLTKGSGVQTSGEGFVVVPVTPPDMDLLITVVSANACEISGTLVNKEDASVLFGIYFASSGGLTNPKTEASLIATVNLAGLETKVIEGYDAFNQSEDEINANLLGFFASHPGISTVYVYLTGDPLPVNIEVHSLALVLKPVAHIQHVVNPDEEYAQYSDQIEDITDVGLSGSAVNNGSSAVTLSLFVSPAEGSTDWQGEVVRFTIQAGETIQFENWSSFLVDGGEERLKACIRYLLDPGEAIRGDLYVESDSEINVHIVSLIFEGKVKVIL